MMNKNKLTSKIHSQSGRKEKSSKAKNHQKAQCQEVNAHKSLGWDEVDQ